MTTTDTEPTRWRKKPVEIDADELLPRVWGLLVQIRLGDALEVSDV